MVQERHNPKRRNMLAETRLLSEYLAATYKGAQWFINLRMGPIPQMPGLDLTDEGQANYIRRFNRWADAVVVTPAQVIVIEAKMWDPSTALGKLGEYILLARATPELLPFMDRPLVGEIVTAQHDPLGALVIRRAGYRYVHYEPAWIDDYYAAYPVRKRQAPHTPLVEELAALADVAPFSQTAGGG